MNSILGDIDPELLLLLITYAIAVATIFNSVQDRNSDIATRIRNLQDERRQLLKQKVHSKSRIINISDQIRIMKSRYNILSYSGIMCIMAIALVALDIFVGDEINFPMVPDEVFIAASIFAFCISSVLLISEFIRGSKTLDLND